MGVRAKVIIGILLVLLMVVFVVQNSEIVDIRFLFWTFKLSEALMILLMFAIGMLCGWFVNSILHL